MTNLRELLRSKSDALGVYSKDYIDDAGLRTIEATIAGEFKYPKINFEFPRQEIDRNTYNIMGYHWDVLLFIQSK
jgi:hypothetical protein